MHLEACNLQSSCNPQQVLYSAVHVRTPASWWVTVARATSSGRAADVETVGTRGHHSGLGIQNWGYRQTLEVTGQM